MEQYDVRFLEDAFNDLEEIILYIANDSKAAAIKMHDLIIEKAKDLTFFPKRGRLVPDKRMAEVGFRMLAAQKYIIFYKIDGKVIHIHRILHGARNYPSLFGMLDKAQD